MGIVNNSYDLTRVIVNALKETEFKVPVINEETGEVSVGVQPLLSSPTDEERDREFNGLVDFTDPVDPQFQESYTSGDEAPGLEKIAEVIAKEVLNYIVENGEVALTARMNKLEQDYNALLASLNTAFINSVGAPPNSAVTSVEYNVMVSSVKSAIEAGGGASRQGDTTEEFIEGTPVQIK